MGVEGTEIITLEDGWREIQKAIDKLVTILEGGRKINFGAQEYIQVYTICYDMCSQKRPYDWSADLYQRHNDTIKQYLTLNVVPAICSKARKGQEHLLLKELYYRWENHKIMNRWLKIIFGYVDRFHVSMNQLPTLEDAGLRCFKKFLHDECKEDATSAILDIINDEREGKVIDKSLVKSIVGFYERMGMSTLDVYHEDLEIPLLSSTGHYYAKKRQDWMNGSTPEYLIKAETAFISERKRVMEYLNPISEVELLRVLEDELLKEAQTELMEKESSGCKALLQNDKKEDLQRMYRFFLRLENSIFAESKAKNDNDSSSTETEKKTDLEKKPKVTTKVGLQPMADIFSDFVKERGMDIVEQQTSSLEGTEKQKNDDPKFVKALIGLHKRFLEVARVDFSGHSFFQRALRDAFSDITNLNVGQFTNAELLCSFCDRVLKNGVEKLNESEIEENLESVVQLFSYLTDKDLFAEIYRNQMAKRLLSQRSLSNDAEKIMIAKLKIQCGTQFTSKLEGILADLAVGVEQRQIFKQKMQSNNKRFKLDCSVQVLTTGFWPTYKTPQVTLTKEMVACTKLFEDWHDNHHQKRKLTWVHTQGSATVQATFGKKTYDLQVTTLQAIALNSFCDGVTLTLEELAQQLNLGESILKPLMHSLSCGKYKVISKTPANSKINKGDKFTAKSKFSSNQRKIRIPMASLESSFNAKKVEEDRTFAIEATIVRIMKARKTLPHQQLLSEVLAQLSLFSPNPRIIKRRIESLIDREFLQRSPGTPGVYDYLA